MSPSTTSRGESSTFLEGLRGLFRGKGRTSTIEETPQATHQTNVEKTVSQLTSAVERLRQTIRERNEEVTAAPAGAKTGTDQNAPKIDPERLRVERQAAELAVAKREMEQDIVALHAKLKTGIDHAQLLELKQFAAPFAELIAGKGEPGMMSRIRVSMLQRIFSECGDLAWQKLVPLMERASITWDQLMIAGHNETTEQRRAAEEHRREDMRATFVNSSFQAAVKLLTGEVDVWRSYPPRDSWLWRDVALRAVGTALRFQLVRTAVDYIRDDTNNIRAELMEVLNEQLGQIQGAIDKGFGSIEEADSLLSQSTQIIEQVVPDLGWLRVEKMIRNQAQAR